MEELDNIVLHTLRQLGCEVEEDITSLAQFSVELTVKAVARCLHIINPDLELPSPDISSNMLSRYSTGTLLAKACMDLGYFKEIDFQIFMYINENELRSLFSFLFEKLPFREKVSSEPLDKSALLTKSLQMELKSQFTRPWLPHYCSPYSWLSLSHQHTKQEYKCQFFRASHLLLPIETKEREVYEAEYLQPVPEQVSLSGLGPSLFQSHALSSQLEIEAAQNQRTAILASRLAPNHELRQKKDRLMNLIAEKIKSSIVKEDAIDVPSVTPKSSLPRFKGSRFVHQEKLEFAKVEEKSVLPVEGEDHMSLLKDQLVQLNETLQATECEIQSQLALQNRCQSELEGQKKVVGELKESHELRRRTADLLSSDGPASIEKLRAVVEAATQRLVALASQWEEHRLPLLAEISQLHEAGSHRLNEKKQMLEQQRVYKEMIKDLAEEARNKDQVFKQLQADYQKLTKDVSRSAYTRRIYEIIGNIKKQRAEIDKVLSDTLAVQKDINGLSGKLDRTFIDIETLMRKQDDAAREAYKYLAALHTNCNLLIKTVKESGSIQREIKDLEDQIDQELQKKVSANLNRITADYEQMKKENASLILQLKGS